MRSSQPPSAYLEAHLEAAPIWRLEASLSRASAPAAEWVRGLPRQVPQGRGGAGAGRILNKVSEGEGNGTPLQYSCLENPMDGGAWWAAVYGFAKSWAQLSHGFVTQNLCILPHSQPSPG